MSKHSCIDCAGQLHTLLRWHQLGGWPLRITDDNVGGVFDGSIAYYLVAAGTPGYLGEDQSLKELMLHVENAYKYKVDIYISFGFWVLRIFVQNDDRVRGWVLL